MGETTRQAGSGTARSTDEPSKPSLLRSWLRRLSGRPGGSIKDAIEDAIEGVFEDHADNQIQLPPAEKEMLRNVLSFGETSVQDIMVPRADILAVPFDVTLEGLKKHIIENRHTRVPVYRDTLDKMDGFLHVKDVFMLIAGELPPDLQKLMRPLIFVPPSMKIIDLLLRMRRARCHMAIVVDEYGGTNGLVTLEDLFEQIVGEIHDEHDEEENQQLVKLSEQSYDADARVRIDMLERTLGIDLLNEQEGEEFDTLGGLIFFELGRVPAKGELVNHNSGLSFEILDADPRRIKRVRISRARGDH